MYVSQETLPEIDARLRGVIAEAWLVTLEEAFVFDEFSHSDFPARIRPDAIALVRDDEVWSQLVPAREPGDLGRERFTLLCFHFPPGRDNSGFVGWLASIIKERVGTGVFVVCGHNDSRGG